MTLPLTIAAFNVHVAIWVVVILFTVGGSIVKYVREQIEAEKARRSRAAREENEVTAEASGRNRADDLAQRRRAELQAMVRSRMGSAPTTAAPTDPNSLSMAERTARAKARAIYEQRAAELRRKQGDPGAQERAQNQAARERLAKLEEARKQAREAAVRKQRIESAQNAADRSAPRAVLSQPAVRSPFEEAPRVAAGPVRATPAPKSRPAGPTRPAPVAVGAARLPMLRGQNLRELVLMREILDPPIALREPDGRY